jgi:hypothetical protein
MCLITFAFIFQPMLTPKLPAHTKSDTVMYVLIVEHIFAYFSGIFRNWEIKHFGKIDVNGVARAQVETFLKTIEVFIDCIIFGYTMNHIFSMTWVEFQAYPYVHFWIIIDFMIMFLTLGYVYMTKLILINSEITKNIYSLHFLQEEQIEAEEIASAEKINSDSAKKKQE